MHTYRKETHLTTKTKTTKTTSSLGILLSMLGRQLPAGRDRLAGKARNENETPYNKTMDFRQQKKCHLFEGRLGGLGFEKELLSLDAGCHWGLF